MCDGVSVYVCVWICLHLDAYVIEANVEDICDRDDKTKVFFCRVEAVATVASSFFLLSQS